MSTDNEGGGPEMVPKSRLDAVLAKLDQANARVGELEGELRATKKEAGEAKSNAASATALAERVTALERDLKAEQKGRAEDAAISAAGFPDVDLVRFEHSRAGKDAGPLDEWLGKLKADRENAPESLRALIPDPDGDEGGEGKTGGDDKKGGTSSRTTNTKPPNDGGQGSKTTSGTKAKNEQLAAIPFELGTPEWREEADRILGHSSPG